MQIDGLGRYPATVGNVASDMRKRKAPVRFRDRAIRNRQPTYLGDLPTALHSPIITTHYFQSPSR
jgi:hypothetical protein